MTYLSHQVVPVPQLQVVCDVMSAIRGHQYGVPGRPVVCSVQLTGRLAAQRPARVQPHLQVREAAHQRAEECQGRVLRDTGIVRRDMGRVRRNAGTVRHVTGTVRHVTGTVRHDTGS